MLSGEGMIRLFNGVGQFIGNGTRNIASSTWRLATTVEARDAEDVGFVSPAESRVGGWWLGGTVSADSLQSPPSFLF